MALAREAGAQLVAFSAGPGLSLHSPVRIRGGKGTLRIGERVMLGYEKAPRAGDGEVLLQPRTPEAVIEIGDRTALSNNVAIVAVERVVLGADCLIGDFVQIVDSQFHELDPERRHASTGASAPVEIGDNVWFGSRVMVLPGVTIGDNSVVGAGSVVTRSIDANCVAAGVPAKVLRTL